MDLRLTRSSFRSIYLALSVAYVAASFVFHLTLYFFVEGRILEWRAESVSSLFRSSDAALHLNDTRALRDELLARHVIAHDMKFLLLKPQDSKDREILRRALNACSFAKLPVCVSQGEAVFFDAAMRSSAPLSTASYAIILETNYFSTVEDLALWDAAGVVLIFAVFIGFGLVLRRKELRLVDSLKVALGIVRNIQNSFLEHEEPRADADEFLEMSQTVERLSGILRVKEHEILGFQKKFERKTRLEQLAQTIGFTSHNLKAPLEETADFIHHLPEYLDSIPRDELKGALASIERRLRTGLETLDNALKKTQQTTEQREVVRLGELVREFEEGLRGSRKFSSLAIERKLPAEVLNARVNVVPSKLDAVFWNLAKNSFDARRNATIEISGQAGVADVQLVFRDNGPGIPWFERRRLFEDFSSTKEDKGGWGLGLSGCRKVLGEFGGSIESIESDEGAVFEIRLPLAPPPSVAAAKLEVSHAHA